MTGFVVLVMSSCHEKDRLWQVMMYIGFCQGDSCIKNVTTEQMTLNDSCHKHA